MPARLQIVLIAAAVAGGCVAGDGSELDDRGRSFEHPAAPGIGSQYGAADFAPTYSGIAEGFFEPFCTACHGGPSAPKGLDLTAEEAYDRLVGVPAVERPELLLVDPGNPDLSYLIIKLEAGPGMAGRQMPRDRPARPPEEIATIRLWIDEGAPED